MHISCCRKNLGDGCHPEAAVCRDGQVPVFVPGAEEAVAQHVAVQEVFGEVPEKDYLDSLWYDIEGAEAEIADNTMYLTLNLARVLAYLEEKNVLSKQEGGEWGLQKLPEKYHALITEALREYRGEEPDYDTEIAEDYAAFMLKCIRTKAGIKEN